MPDERIVRAISSLGDIEERLRRTLSLVGVVGTELPFPLAVNADVHVADATLPGNNAFRGRRWMAASALTGVAATTPSSTLKAVADIIVEAVYIFATGAGLQGTLKIADPSVADPYAVNTAVFWSERPDGSRAPAVNGGSNTIVGVGNTLGVFRGAAGIIIPLGMFLQAGAKASFETAAITGDVYVTWFGRVF